MRFGQYTNAHFDTQDTFNNIPCIREFEIVKNSKGEYELNGFTMQQLSPTLKKQLDEQKNNKNASESLQEAQKNQQKPQAQQIVSLKNRQLTESIILEKQSDQSSNIEQKNKIISKDKKNPLKNKSNDLSKSDIENKRLPKVRIPLLTLSNEQKPILKIITLNSNKAMTTYSEKGNYFENTFCCGVLYTSDCFLKWIADFIFKTIMFILNFIIFLLKTIFIICTEDENEEEEKQNQSAKTTYCKDCCYCPIECCCGWLNQLVLSLKLFICQGLWFLPQQSLPLFDTSNQRCLIQCGMFFKNCCFFKSSLTIFEKLLNLLCLKPFHLLGECLQSLCSPQGLCELFFANLKRFTCNVMNQNCIKQFFFCCSKSVKFTAKNNQEITINYCFGCAIETIGDTSNIEENIL